MMKRLMIAAFLLTLSCLSAAAQSCWPDPNQTRANCGVPVMYLNASSQSIPVDATHGLPVSVIAGTAIIGKVSIDQTTPGTTNGVQVNAALPAGSNVIGHVIADTGSTTAVTALPAIPTGSNVIGTVGLSSQYPVGATPITASVLNANAIIAPSLAGTSGKTTYITGFELTAGGATTAGCFNVALSGTVSATMNYSFCTVTGVSFASPALFVHFNPAIPASATNTAITLTVPALGAGNVTTSGTLHGYQL